jgi:hypothetical protein
MWLREWRDKVWKVIRWDVEHKAWESRCDAKVLHGVSLKCFEGCAILGYHAQKPPDNRDAQYYKDYIAFVSRNMRTALDRWEVPDCSLTKAIVPFEDAARRLRDCSPDLANPAPETFLIHPAES